MTDIITGLGLYVLRNGKFVAIASKWADGWSTAEDARFWSSDGCCHSLAEHDIIRRATPEEAAKFCGLTLESK